MKKLNYIILAATAALAVSAQGQSAIQILNFQDFSKGTSVVPGAVSLLGSGYLLTTATSQSQFNTALSAGGWGLVIFGEQGSDSVYSGSASQLSTYVAGGGKLIASSWLSSSGLLSLMDANAAGVNASLITTIADGIYSSPYSVGSTIALANPGYGNYDQYYNPINGAQGVGTLGSGYAVIRGNGGRTLLDGPLFDTYANLPQGQQFLADEIVSLTSVASVPEPSTVALAGLGGLSLLALRRKK